MSMGFVNRILTDPRVYALWIMPFARRKIAPLLPHVDLPSVRRVLDLAVVPEPTRVSFIVRTMSGST